MKQNRKLYIIFIIMISIFCMSIVKKTMQNDTFFTIPIGNYILNNGITSQEQFTWHQGLEFTNSRWLFDIIIAFIYNNFNFCGVYVFTMFLSALVGVAIFNMLLMKKNNILISFILTLLMTYFSRVELCARAQIISYILFILEICFIELLLEKNQKRYMFLLIIDSILLANFHASVWPIFFVLFLPYFAEYICVRLKVYKEFNKLTAKNFNVKLLLITFCIAIFSGLCTPIGLAPYTDMPKVLFGVTKQFVAELKPTNILETLGIFVIFFMYISLFIYPQSKLRISYFCLTMRIRNDGIIITKKFTIFLFDFCN